MHETFKKSHSNSFHKTLETPQNISLSTPYKNITRSFQLILNFTWESEYDENNVLKCIKKRNKNLKSEYNEKDGLKFIRKRNKTLQ
jgi:hypothetical protein